MNVNRRMIMCALFSLLWVAQGVHACSYPVIVIGNTPCFTGPGVAASLGANCISGGPISSWYWQPPFSVATSDSYHSTGTGSWTNPGYYSVYARGWNGYHYGYGYGSVWVVKMNQVITDPCVADASELNPGLFLGVGNTATVKLRYLPTNLADAGGSEKLLALDSASWTVKVYDGGTLIIYGSDKEQVWPLAPTRQVTVEGYEPGIARLDLSYYRDPVRLGETDQINVTVVEVYNVAEDVTGYEGPLYVVCPEDTVLLHAFPWPSEGPWPSGEPHWEFVSQPGATGVITPFIGSDIVEVSGFGAPGEYVVKAKCGIDDVGDEITIITPPPQYYWRLFEPNFACPPRSGESNQKCKYDNCGNRLAVYCDANNSGQFTAYSWWYLPAGATPRGTEVGICVWIGGQNSFEYKVTDKTNYGKERFLETHHATQNDAKGVDGDGEGCDGYWCWRVERYDCVHDTPLGQGVWWRRRDWGPGTTEYQGIACAGPGGKNGKHNLYPN